MRILKTFNVYIHLSYFCLKYTNEFAQQNMVKLAQSRELNGWYNKKLKKKIYIYIYDCGSDMYIINWEKINIVENINVVELWSY
jgi:hypothetical protein